MVAQWLASSEPNRTSNTHPRSAPDVPHPQHTPAHCSGSAIRAHISPHPPPCQAVHPGRRGYRGCWRSHWAAQTAPGSAGGCSTPARRVGGGGRGSVTGCGEGRVGIQQGGEGRVRTVLLPRRARLAGARRSRAGSRLMRVSSTSSVAGTRCCKKEAAMGTDCVGHRLGQPPETAS